MSKNRGDKIDFTDTDPNSILDLLLYEYIENNKSEIIGNFLIKENLPFEMAEPYVENLKNTMFYENARNEVIREAVNQMYLVSFIVAVSHILHSSNSIIREKYKHIISVTDIKNLELPPHLNITLNLIGTINCKLGKLEMKYSEAYIEGWATLAHEHYIQNNNDHQINISDIGKKITFPVWNSSNGTIFIIQKYCDWYNKHLGEFSIKIYDKYVIVSTPTISPINFEKYVIQPEYTYNNVDRDVLVNSFNSIRQWINHNYQGNVVINGTVYSLRDNFDMFKLVNLLASDFRHFFCTKHYFKHYFKTNKCRITKTGSVAQLVSKGESDYVIKCPVPMSDGEAWYGYITTPCLEYYITNEAWIRFLYQSEHDV